MKREKINKEDVYKNFGWRYEDGDYEVKRESRKKNFLKRLKDLINRLIKKNN